jgi:alpha-amylase
MQPRLYLGLVLHNHQPVGNYGFVFDELYRTAYEPMLAALERHPGVRAAVHNSGPLSDWILTNQPDYVKRASSVTVDRSRWSGAATTSRSSL